MITMDDLDAALPHILSAPKDDVAIDILCTRPSFGKRAYPDHIEVSPEGGIMGERWLKHPWSRLEDGSPDPRIQVSILPKRVFDLVVQDRLHPGDTIIADIDTSTDNLAVGQQLKIGTAVVEVTDLFNDGCVKWKVRYGADAKNWIIKPENIDLRLRGVLCKITQAGIITKTDRIQKL
ncbi:hypothetical protein [Pacificibacter sp. AS14]|uniref:hypothetical protein n=1 Tax=Pacificibacter sp. AS14 TaxID=3135785 RepID=UPI0031827608